ncbi:MAG: hypothetical protein ACI8WB_001736 [Phenylobacterium sp.]|jgi:hypothetical protein
MAFEQDVAELVTASDNLTGMINTQLNGINTRLAQAEGLANSFAANVERNKPIYRLSKNQILEGTTGSVPDFWLSGSGVTYTLVQKVEHQKEWADRTAEERELLTAMGREGLRYLHMEFNIWRMDWVPTDVTFTLYQRGYSSGPVTIAGMTKLLSGSTDGFWAAGATNEWKLTGQTYMPEPYGYIHTHPVKEKDSSGSMLFALPALIAGIMPLDDARTWWTFPYLGDEQSN